MKAFFLGAVAAMTLMGCTTPTQYTDQPMLPFDKDTEYAIAHTDHGFIVSVRYAKFQLNAEGAAAMLVCKQQLTAVAHDFAKKQGRRIKPVNEQAIKISTGRNVPALFITSCTANVEVEWAD